MNLFEDAPSSEGVSLCVVSLCVLVSFVCILVVLGSCCVLAPMYCPPRVVLPSVVDFLVILCHPHVFPASMSARAACWLLHRSGVPVKSIEMRVCVCHTVCVCATEMCV